MGMKNMDAIDRMGRRRKRLMGTKMEGISGM